MQIETNETKILSEAKKQKYCQNISIISVIEKNTHNVDIILNSIVGIRFSLIYHIVLLSPGLATELIRWKCKMGYRKPQGMIRHQRVMNAWILCGTKMTTAYSWGREKTWVCTVLNCLHPDEGALYEPLLLHWCWWGWEESGRLDPLSYLRETDRF